MKKTSLKWQIAFYLGAFAAVLIAVIWIFQMFLLQPMFEKSKISAVRKTADTVSEAILSSSDDLNEAIYDISVQNETCVRILTSNMNVIAGNSGCALYRMSGHELRENIDNAVKNGGSYLNTSTDPGFEMDGRELKEITYTKIVEKGDDLNVVMVYTGITPLSATTNTLRSQLKWITLIVIVLITLIIIVLNRKIALPLSSITKEAARLPDGAFHADEKNNQYLEAQQLNETLEQAADDIRKADQAKRDLIANVSHDLRTPLTMISGYGEMMQDLPGENNEENLQVIIDESKRLTSLVNDLLDLSKMQAGRITLELQDFDLAELVSSEIRKYDVYQYNESFEFEVHLPEKAMVHADEKRIEQVFNNFMTNAINYSGSARKIIITMTEENGSVRTSVRDFGEGIDEKDLRNIWDRYYKVDKQHVRFSSGSGLGLSIVKEILDLHDAKYGVSSKKNEGSTFWFELPLIQK
ncbi:MAG: HAMP domain-containing histidine kinase [Solobacterium sp.]|nr:HAMP domain-containing histidine kinase [Solobacterium sp.]